MHITQIKGQGVKGRTFDLALGRITAITGANRSGKTAVRDTLLLGLFGFHPDLPRTNKGTMTMANGPEIRVGLKFSDGTTIQRDWTVGKAGRISQYENGPTDLFTDLAPFVPATFLATGATARLSYMASMGDPATMRAALENAFGDDDKIMAIYDASEGPLDALKAIEEHVTERRRATKQEVTRLKAAIKEASANSVDITPETQALADAAPDLRKQLADKEATLRALRTRARDLTQEREAVASAWRSAGLDPLEDGAVPALTEKEAARLVELNERATWFGALEGARRRLNADINECLASFLDSESRDFLTQQVEAFNDLTDQAMEVSEATVKRLELNATEAARKAVTAEHEFAEAKRARDYALEDRKRAEASRKCSACGHELTDQEIETLHGAKIQQAQSELERKSVVKDAAQGEDQAVQRKLTVALGARTALASARTAAIDLRREAEARAKHDQLQAELDDAFAKRLDPVEVQELADLDNRKKRRDAWSSLPLWTGDDDMRRVLEDISLTETEVSEIRGRSAQADAAAMQVQARTSHLANVERMTTEHEQAEQLQERSEAKVAQLNGAKTSLLEAVWRPVIGVADTVLRATFRDTTLRADVTDTDIGIVDGAGFRPFDVLSGSEQTVMAMALAIGLATRAPARIALVDEIGRLDDRAMDGFLDGIRELINTDKVDQVILLGHRFPVALPEAATVIKFE
jgi:hypothetical protein